MWLASGLARLWFTAILGFGFRCLIVFECFGYLIVLDIVVFKDGGFMCLW